MIDWSKLKAYETDQKKSFEELCYQIARLEFDEKGTFTSVDDSGGGDGVEFYMTLPNGEQWGWQAKFYLDGSLSISNRKKSIKSSLEKAIKVHPDLKKWYLCMPKDLTPGEKEWFDTTLKKVIPEELSIDLDFWGESDLIYFMGDPKFSGRKNYFFGDLELTLDWFNTQVSNQLAVIHGKYNPAVHTQTKADSEINIFLLSDEYKKELKKQFQLFSKSIKENNDVLLKIQAIDVARFPLKVKEDYLRQMKTTLEFFGKLLSIINTEILSLEKGYYLEKDSLQLEKEMNMLSECIKELRDKTISIVDNHLIKETDVETYNIDSVEMILSESNKTFDDMYYDFKETMDKIIRSRSNNLNIFGDAGFGKTHLTAHIANQTIQKGLPAIFISGKNITDSRLLSEQILSSLDIPRNYSWIDFLKALDVAGKAFRSKIPIIIDGLNEARDISIVKVGIHRLISEISSFHNIGLITTCRKTYVKPIFEKNSPTNSIYLHGFLNENLLDAVEIYFDYYKLKADISSVSLDAFEHPLYLQIFCQTKNPKRIEEKHILINEHSMFDIFDIYLNQCDEHISERLNLNPRKKIITKKLTNLGNAMWERNTRFIPVDQAEELLELNQPHNWNESIEKNLTDENLLIYRDWYKGVDNEVITFTYDLLGGYIIAKNLIEKHKSCLQEFLNDPNTVKLLFGEDYKYRHPLYEDIGRCIAALLPNYQENYLIDYIENGVTVNLTINSLFEISPEKINDKAKDLITTYFSEPQNRANFFIVAEKTIRQVNHPLNINFWTILLKDLSMAERDISWSEHIRDRQYHHITENINRLEKRSMINVKKFSTYDKNYLFLLAEYVMWTLTSTIRPLRDKATRALYYFGRAFPEKFFDLLVDSFSINDPYISERMLAALYGIGMAKQFDFEDTEFKIKSLPIMAKTLYELMFAEEAKYFTTHILTRDYGRRFIEISLLYNPALLNEIEKVNIRPPYPRIKKRNWGVLHKKKISDVYKPIRMDFENYTIGRLVKNRSNYDFEHEDYNSVRAQIYWRIYNLGYLGELFENIDNEIHNGNFRYEGIESGKKTDRYGKKYSWIAFFEMAGYRDDQGLLEDNWYKENCRISEIDIDPSFPVEIPNFQLVSKDYLNDNLSVDDWFYGSAKPDFNDYFVVDEINGENGPWVLLDGYYSDSNKEQTKRCFFFPRGMLIRNLDCENITSHLSKQAIGGRWLPEIPYDFYVFAGEIPWAETFSENELSKLEFEIKKEDEIVEVEKTFLFKGDEKLNPYEEREFIGMLNQEEKISFQTYLSYLIQDLDAIDLNELNLTEYGFKIKKELVKESIEKKKNETFQVLLPVREHHCDITSEIMPRYDVVVPCKQIANLLELVGQPQTYDLYEKNGSKASITVDYRDSLGNHQHFTYLRKDLLSKFLQKEGYKLIWGLWGQKEILYKNEEERQSILEKYKEIDKAFQEIFIYQEENGEAKPL
ncbi:NACHT domain-containing protein [Bacillus subtilis]|uniref:NACHT domain-containing protein n=2 Tax=Bacillus subtilis TaxID=1423 RepID=UPI00257252C2|nr:hypothetical protein [Bacillus subtilis]WJF85407.1 hypothetical protein QSU94_13015 [Bacillus subtilis]